MHLTTAESEMLNGKRGPVLRKAIEILVALAESYGADRFVPISGAHLPGCSLVVAGRAWVEFLEGLRGKGGRFAVSTTTNPTATDPANWRKMGLPADKAALQERLIGAIGGLGATTCNTCTPYLMGTWPRFGEHVAWGESSAVAFVNSVLGARTNREGGPSAIASALTGLTPLAGLHLTENRAGTLLVKVRAPLRTSEDYSLLGYFVGLHCTEGVPVFDGVPGTATIDDLKQLSASLASSGAVALYHVVGVTPEAVTLGDAFQGRQPAETIEFTPADLKATQARLSSAPGTKVSWVVLGCPHASLRELRELSGLMKGRRVSGDVAFWVVTSAAMRDTAKALGYLTDLEAAGALVVSDTCPVLTFSRDIAKVNGFTDLATNSAKMAHYSPGQFGVLARYGRLAQCVDAAVTGQWR